MTLIRRYFRRVLSQENLNGVSTAFSYPKGSAVLSLQLNIRETKNTKF